MIRLNQRVSTSSGFIVIAIAVIILFGGALTYQLWAMKSLYF
jgi:hypothetical protein